MSLREVVRGLSLHKALGPPSSLRNFQHWENGGTKRASQNLTKQLYQAFDLTSKFSDLVLGAFQRHTAVSRAMSSSQCLRRLAASSTTSRAASLLRCNPTTSKNLLRSSIGFRTLSTCYPHSNTHAFASRPRYVVWESQHASYF